MTVRTRFAPSPTGFLHIGGARTALYNWLFARKHGGEFILRIEDTDAVRNAEDSLAAILKSMRWLNLEWDVGPGKDENPASYLQSHRDELYRAYLEKLQSAGKVYEDKGAIRFRTPDREITLEDKVCGMQRVNLREQGARRWDAEAKREVEANPDFVIRRPDGSFIFHLVNVVDDIDMGITHVIRGEDHLSNTPKHLALYEALGVDPPEFAHLPLNLNLSGSKMGKRDKGALIHEYIEKGFLPSAVNNYMALLGWSPGTDREIYIDMDELIDDFSLEGINQSNSKFDYEKCVWVNSEHIKALAPADFLSVSAPFLEKAGIDPTDSRIPEGLELARKRAETLRDVPNVLDPVFTGDLSYDSAAVSKAVGREGILEAVEALAEALKGTDSWEEEAIKESIMSASDALGVKMGALMLPCRVATTGSLTGADLVPLLRLIGQETVVERIVKFRGEFLN